MQTPAFQQDVQQKGGKKSKASLKAKAKSKQKQKAEFQSKRKPCCKILIVFVKLLLPEW